jgi:nitrite reductase (NAD(P)H)
MTIGDTKDYVKLVPMVKNQKILDIPPSQLILGTSKVARRDELKVTRDGSCKSIGDVKSCTKASTKCGSCMSLVTSIFFNRSNEVHGK